MKDPKTAASHIPISEFGVADGYSQTRRRYFLVLLSLVYAVNYLDRQILSILLEPIKQEFAVSDSLIGFLAGPSFALFYATLGLPIAYLADRRNRKDIIAASLALFGVMTVFCGIAKSFWLLALARIGTGIGEAGTGPAAQAIISDLYPPQSRATAQGIYALGLNVGIMVAFAFGGWFSAQYGWRQAFLLAGVPALVLATIIATGTRDPRHATTSGAAAPPIVETFSYLYKLKTFRWILLGTSMSAFAGYGATAFVPAFLMRSHQMSPTDVGISLAVIAGLGGAAGTFLSGYAADKLGRRDYRWNLYVPMYAAVLMLFAWPVFLIAPGRLLALAASVIPLSLGAAFVAPCIAVVQGLTPSRMRATAAATQLMIGNLIGLGLGPQIVGILSDLLAPFLGRDSLRYALLSSFLATAVSMWAYKMGAVSLTKEGQTGIESGTASAEGNIPR